MNKSQVAIAFSILCVIVISVIMQFERSISAQDVAATSTPAPDVLQAHMPPVTNLVFDAIPGPDVPTLQELAVGTTSDAEIISAVVAYFEANRERLQVLWREDNPVRLAGIFSMYVVHISHPYGETEYPSSFVEYLSQPRAHCGTYSIAQARIAEGLGLTWRMWELTSGWHGWVEIYVDDHWEIFDATTNNWINKSAEELLNGEPRQYRAFYTPLLDINRPDARFHLDEGYNMQRFRTDFVGLGLFYNPPGEPFLSVLPELWE